MNKYKLVIALIAIATITFLLLNKSKSKNKIKIGYQETSLYQHIFVAKEKNYFKEQGIEAELVSFKSGNQMMQALISGDIDVLGLANLQVALTVEAKEAGKFKMINFLVWGKDSYPDYIITRKKSQIKSLKELEGKSVGLHPGSAVKSFASTIFKLNNVNEDKINTLELEPSLMQSSLFSDNIQGLYCMDPTATKLMATGECEILMANPMQFIFPAPTPISGTAVNSKIAGDKKLIKKINAAIDKAIDFTRVKSNTPEIHKIIASYTPMKADVMEKMNPSEYWKSQETDINRVQELANKFYDLKIVDKKINIRDIFAND